MTKVYARQAAGKVITARKAEEKWFTPLPPPPPPEATCFAASYVFPNWQIQQLAIQLSRSNDLRWKLSPRAQRLSSELYSPMADMFLYVCGFFSYVRSYISNRTVIDTISLSRGGEGSKSRRRIAIAKRKIYESSFFLFVNLCLNNDVEHFSHRITCYVRFTDRDLLFIFSSLFLSLSF